MHITTQQTQLRKISVQLQRKRYQPYKQKGKNLNFVMLTSKTRCTAQVNMELRSSGQSQ